MTSMLYIFTFDKNVTMATQENCSFGRNETNITMISNMLVAANNGKGEIRVLSNDAGFVCECIGNARRTYSADYRWSVRREQSSTTMRPVLTFGQYVQYMPSVGVMQSFPFANGKISALDIFWEGTS